MYRTSLVTPAKQQPQVLRFVVAQHWIDPCDTPVLRFEPEILVLQVAQTLAREGGRGQHYDRQRDLGDHQQLLRPRRAPRANGTTSAAQRIRRVSMRSHPR